MHTQTAKPTPNWVRRAPPGVVPDSARMRVSPSQNTPKLFGCCSALRGLGRPPPLRGWHSRTLSPPAGTLARGARSRPNPLSGHGTGSGISTGSAVECYRGEAREGPAPEYWGRARQVLVGWRSPMQKNYSKSPPRLRTLILTREFELASEWGSSAS